MVKNSSLIINLHVRQLVLHNPTISSTTCIAPSDDGSIRLHSCKSELIRINVLDICQLVLHSCTISSTICIAPC